MLRPSLLIVGCVALGCQQSSPTAIATDTALPSPTLPQSYAVTEDLTDSLVGRYAIAIDRDSLAADVTSIDVRASAANSDVYLLDTQRFFGPEDLAVTEVGDANGVITVTYRIRHPFPAPSDPDGSPNATTNRADLGIAGLCLFGVNVLPSETQTFFDGVLVNTDKVLNADGYLRPGGLVDFGIRANTFPFQVMVSEGGTGSRVGISNGGKSTGNFGADGWTRAELGTAAPYTGWTGYGVLHQGQESVRTLELNAASFPLINPIVTFEAALIARYNDPRAGVDATTKQANRLPPTSPDHGKFAYRMPHGALDIAQVRVAGRSGDLIAGQPTQLKVGLHLVDWDANATPSPYVKLAQDPQVTRVLASEVGLPEIGLELPGLHGHASFTQAHREPDEVWVGGNPEYDSGLEGDPLYYEFDIVAEDANALTPGTYHGLLQVNDPEAYVPVATPLAGDPLAPFATDRPTARVYLPFEFAVHSAATSGWAARTTSTSVYGDASIAVADTGSIFVLGTRTDNTTHLLTRFNAIGIPLWEKMLAVPAIGLPARLAATADGGLAIGGSAEHVAVEGDPSWKQGRPEPVLTKFDRHGDFQWQRRGVLGTTAPVGGIVDDIAADPARDVVYVAGGGWNLDFGLGELRPGTPVGITGLLYAFNGSTGAPLSADVGFPEWTHLNAVDHEAHGHVLAAGYVERVSDILPALPATFGDGDVMALGWTPAGERIWTAAWGREGQPDTTVAIADVSSTVVMVATRSHLLGFNADTSVRFAQELKPAGVSGVRLLVQDLTSRHDGTAHLLSELQDVAYLQRFDSEGAEFQLLQMPTTTLKPDAITATATGNIAWCGRLQGTADFDPSPTSAFIIHGPESSASALVVTHLHPDFTW